MSIYKSDDGKAFLEFSNIQICDANGSKTMEYLINISSHGFSVLASGIWFYHDDLVDFCKKIEQLASRTRNEASVSAMSDFILSVVPKDSQGHFTAKAKISNQFYGNTAEIRLELETQTLLNLAQGLKNGAN
jgi:hypothetical protein